MKNDRLESKHRSGSERDKGGRWAFSDREHKMIE